VLNKHDKQVLFQKAKSKHNKQIGAKYIPAHSVQTADKNEIKLLHFKF